MLVLSRKTGEQLVLKMGHETIVVQVCRISGSRVSIGVDASRQVDVQRGELALARVSAQRD